MGLLVDCESWLSTEMNLTDRTNLSNTITRDSFVDCEC